MPLKLFKSLHKAAVALGERRATKAGQKVKPKVGVREASAAAKKMGKYSHKNA